ncbi:MAG: cysteine--tRNA ligase [Candidatus Omnitrophica bacterium]|nr:cysteine--tRNA ligase [Candidatus Omnitrophota bacterium]MDD5487646.1 cysteine--tRNA ligase [Candidatus Omnitrophota bacterium]
MRIYNTLTREKDEFRPIDDGKVKMYVCGPTVYDVPHIGHARSAYVFDVIRRYMEFGGLDVTFVRNVTDIDDKIIRKAVQEMTESGDEPTGDGLAEKVKEVALRYLEVYHDELDMLGIKKPTLEPRATDNIKEMIGFIGELIKKGNAYVSGESVYFSVDSFKDYGRLSNRDKEQLLAGARVEKDENKRDPLDFALWKGVKPGEPYWESPWGRGRPGWHIECSVMSTKMLGTGFDIHGGGLDLIFPHHENEIAQAEAYTGRRFANYWIHNGLLTVNGEKMSKSLGNYITIADFLEAYEDPDLLKLAFLVSVYRSPMDYSGEKIEEMRRAKERITVFMTKASEMADKYLSGEGTRPKTMVMDGYIADAEKKILEAMDDDFNTPVAMSVIFEAVKTGNERMADEAMPAEARAHALGQITGFIRKYAEGLFGLNMKIEDHDEGVAREVEGLLEERAEAKKKKDFAAADSIRDRLNGMGIVVEDTPDGPVWRKK